MIEKELKYVKKA